MRHCHPAYLHAVLVGLRQHLRLALPSAQPRAHNLLLTHHLARAARTCRATFSHKNTFFTRSAQIPISLIGAQAPHSRALPPLPPTSPLAYKASSPEVRPPHSSSSSSYSSLSSSSSSAPPPVARRPESLSWKRPLLTAHSHVSTTTTPPSMTCHTLLPTPHKSLRSSPPYICQNCQMHNCQNLQFYLAKWQHSIHMSPVPILSMTGQWSGHSLTLAPFHLQFNLNFP